MIMTLNNASLQKGAAGCEAGGAGELLYILVPKGRTARGRSEAGVLSGPVALGHPTLAASWRNLNFQTPAAREAAGPPSLPSPPSG